MTNEQIEVARQMYDAGASDLNIAKTIGVGSTAVLNWRRKNKLLSKQKAGWKQGEKRVRPPRLPGAPPGAHCGNCMRWDPQDNEPTTCKACCVGNQRPFWERAGCYGR